MRKVFGPILMGLGAFLLVVAVLAVTWMPGVVKKTPLDIDTTTHLSGEAQRLDKTGSLGSAVPIAIQSVTQTDADKSDDKVVVWRSGSCVVENADGQAPGCVDGKDPRLVSASEDAFATDRVTAEAVPNGDYLPAGTVQHEGLINKFPFDAKKKTYPYWDGTVGKALDAVYQSTETIRGIKTYKYQVKIEDAPVDVAEGVKGTYSNEVNIWVEPVTGAILNQSQDQQRYLADGSQVLNLQAEFTDAQVKSSASDADANMAQLKLLLFWVPLVGFVVGAIALLAGLLLVLSGRRRTVETSSGSRSMAGSAH